MKVGDLPEGQLSKGCTGGDRFGPSDHGPRAKRRRASYKYDILSLNYYYYTSKYYYYCRTTINSGKPKVLDIYDYAIRYRTVIVTTSNPAERAQGENQPITAFS